MADRAAKKSPMNLSSGLCASQEELAHQRVIHRRAVVVGIGLFKPRLN